MHSPFRLLIPLSGLIFTGNLSAATTYTPEVTLSILNSAVTPDSSFTSGGPGSSFTRVDTNTGPASGSSTLAGTHQSSGTKTSGTPTMGGTLQWNSSSSFNGNLEWSQSSSEGSWSFNSTYKFNSSLDYQATSTTYGNFFYALAASNTNALSFDRYAQIEVSQPLSIQLSLATSFSGPASPLQANTVLLGAPFTFQGIFFSTTGTALMGNPGAEPFVRSGTRGNLSYSVTGRGTADGIFYDILVSPITTGVTETLELRWFLDQESKLQKGGTNRLSVSMANSGTIQESLRILAIPEPSPWMLATAGFVGVLGRRKRPVAERVG